MNSSQQLRTQQFDRAGSSLYPNRSQSIGVQTLIEQPDQANNLVRDIRQQMNGAQQRSDSSEKTTDLQLLDKSKEDSIPSDIRIKLRISKITFIQALSLSWFVEQLGEFQFFIYFFMGEFYQNKRSNDYIGWMVIFIITTTFYLLTYALTYYVIKNKGLPFQKQQELENQDQPYIPYLIIYILQTTCKIFMDISLIMLICTLYNDPELVLVILYVGYKIIFISIMIGIIFYTFFVDYFNMIENSKFEKHQWIVFDFFQSIPFCLSIIIGFSILKSAIYFQFLIPQMIIQILIITILHKKLKNFPVNISQDQRNPDSIPLKIMDFSLQFYSPWNINLLK
ncbi:hypothetical protein pb186bvf_020900 [Paramecium bursaria]